MRKAKGFENFKGIQRQKLGKVEKIYLGGHQRGVLKLARGAVIVPLQSALGVRKMDGQSKQQEDKQECDMEVFSRSSAHRIPIPNTIIYEKTRGKVNPGEIDFVCLGVIFLF